MEEFPFRVSLTASGGLDKKTLLPKSIRFTIPSTVVSAYDLKKGDNIYFQITGLIREKNQKEPTKVNIPIWAKVSSAGGNSLALTIDKKQAVRYKLTTDDEIEIIIKEIRKTT